MKEYLTDQTHRDMLKTILHKDMQLVHFNFKSIHKSKIYHLPMLHTHCAKCENTICVLPERVPFVHSPVCCSLLSSGPMHRVYPQDL